jgi:hypothetical protein
MYLQTIAEEEATGRVADINERQKSQMGFVMAAARCFTARPDLLPVYTEFSDRIRSGFCLGLREWRLITLVAAKHIPSTYCSYVYGKQLVGDLGSKEAVLGLTNGRPAGQGRGDAGLRGEDRIGRIPDLRSRYPTLESRRVHGPGDLRHRALRFLPVLREPVLRRRGRGPGHSLHRRGRGVSGGPDREPGLLRPPIPG